MTTKLSSKAIALGAISILLACILAIVNTVAQSYLFEIKKAIAELEAARAANKAAEAQTLDAINKLKGTENAAGATIAAAQYEASAIRGAAEQTAAATMNAAKTNADALVHATRESVRAENTQFDNVIAPLMADPAKRMAQLNEEIVGLKRELESGYHAKSALLLTTKDVAEKTNLKRIREEELATLKETTSKNWSDSMGMMMGVFTQGLGGLGSLYPSDNTPAPPPRRIIQEQ